MRLEENLDSHILGETQRFVQFFPQQKNRLGIGQVFTEFGRGFALGGNHMSHPDGRRGFHRLDDLCCAVAPWSSWVEKVGVRAPGRYLEAVLCKKPGDVMWVRIQAR